MSKRNITLLVAIVSVMFLGGAVQRAVADPVTFLFTGNVTGVDPALAGTFDTTQTLSGFYTFESTLADSIPADPTVGLNREKCYADHTGSPSRAR